jgi:hypothetical protein
MSSSSWLYFHSGIAVSEMVVEEGLFPKRAGVEAMYKRQISKRETFGREDVFLRGSLVDELGPFAYIYRGPPIPAETSQLESCTQLFTGLAINGGEYAAIAHEGICIYRCILNSVSDNLEISGKIHILPGIIEHQGHPHTRVAYYNEVYRSSGTGDRCDVGNGQSVYPSRYEHCRNNRAA